MQRNLQHPEVIAQCTQRCSGLGDTSLTGSRGLGAEGGRNMVSCMLCLEKVRSALLTTNVNLNSTEYLLVGAKFVNPNFGAVTQGVKIAFSTTVEQLLPISKLVGVCHDLTRIKPPACRAPQRLQVNQLPTNQLYLLAGYIFVFC